MTALFVRAMTEEGTSEGDRVSGSNSSSSSSSGVDTEHHRHDDCSTAVDLQRISPLVMPSAVEQRAVISSLESQDRGPAEEQRGVPESSGRQYVYTVSRSWYERWSNYVGLGQTRPPSDAPPNSLRCCRDGTHGVCGLFSSVRLR